MLGFIFGRSERGILKIELWFLLPIVYFFSLILSLIPSREYTGLKEFNPVNLIILNIIYSIMIIITYLIKYIYKKLKGEKI